MGRKSFTNMGAHYATLVVLIWATSDRQMGEQQAENYEKGIWSCPESVSRAENSSPGSTKESKVAD